MSGWRDSAACLGEDPELFFPIGNTGPAVLQIEEAKAVCRRCDVVETCLRWALDTQQDAGVWGGLSEDERRALKRRTSRARRAGEPVPSLAEAMAGTRARAERRRHAGGGTPVDAGPLRDELGRLPQSAAELAEISRRVSPDAPLDSTAFSSVRAGRRGRVFEGTRSRMQAVLDEARRQASAGTVVTA